MNAWQARGSSGVGVRVAPPSPTSHHDLAPDRPASGESPSLALPNPGGRTLADRGGRVGGVGAGVCGCRCACRPHPRDPPASPMPPSPDLATILQELWDNFRLLHDRVEKLEKKFDKNESENDSEKTAAKCAASLASRPSQREQLSTVPEEQADTESE